MLMLSIKREQQNEYYTQYYVNCKHTRVRADATWSRGPGRISKQRTEHTDVMGSHGRQEGENRSERERKRNNSKASSIFHNARRALFIVMVCHKPCRMTQLCTRSHRMGEGGVDGGHEPPSLHSNPTPTRKHVGTGGEAYVHVVHKYLLRICSVPNTVLGTVDTVLNKTV